MESSQVCDLYRDLSPVLIGRDVPLPSEEQEDDGSMSLRISRLQNQIMIRSMPISLAWRKSRPRSKAVLRPANYQKANRFLLVVFSSLYVHVLRYSVRFKVFEGLFSAEKMCHKH